MANRENPYDTNFGRFQFKMNTAKLVSLKVRRGFRNIKVDLTESYMLK